MRYRTREISILAREKDEPIFLTKNGEGEMVIMTMEHYERLKAQAELFEQLGIAQSQAAAGKKKG